VPSFKAQNLNIFKNKSVKDGAVASRREKILLSADIDKNLSLVSIPWAGKQSSLPAVKFHPAFKSIIQEASNLLEEKESMAQSKAKLSADSLLRQVELEYSTSRLFINPKKPSMPLLIPPKSKLMNFQIFRDTKASEPNRINEELNPVTERIKARKIRLDNFQLNVGICLIKQFKLDSMIDQSQLGSNSPERKALLEENKKEEFDALVGSIDGSKTKKT
jgi:hypothetical protein